MEPQKQIILVPTDFTEIAGFALEHAVKYSKLLNKEITLLHIIKKDTEYLEAEERVKDEAAKASEKFGVRIHPMVQEGSIFTTIGETANDLEASLIVMGTHGMHGIQKITGSWALKVTVKSKAPVIIVQEPPKREKIQRLVFPLDFKKENKEKIGWTCFMAKLFNAKILVFKSKFKDKSFIRNILINFRFTEKYFKNHDVDYEVFIAEPKKNFAHQTVEFARKVDADMILIMTTKAISVTDYILGASEQYIIANEAKIPVMCINPRPTYVGGFSATGN
jgi:Universal stress protein UspA and related nucleotide-binding proteins